MSLLSPLLEIQAIDRARDQLLVQRAELPERKEESRAEAKIATIDEAHSGLVARRAAFEKDEHAMGDQVAAVAAKAKGVEDTLYGGTVTAAKDLSTLQDEIAAIRVKQSELEEQELSLLEEIEGVESKMADNRGARGEVEAQLDEILARLRAAEGVIDAEVAERDGEKAGLAASLPEPIMKAYEQRRTNQRLNGVAAAALTEKGCGGCKMQLPRLEVSLMREKPEDALLECENCGRLLVR